jgi:hypothetical protein
VRPGRLELSRRGRRSPGAGRGLLYGVLIGLVAHAVGACGAGDGAPAAAAKPAVLVEGQAAASAQVLRARGWRTDFTRAEVPIATILDGGLSPEIFHPITNPRFARADETDLEAADPVVVFRGSATLRAWPLVHLLRRELVLDQVEDLPVAVTFCSLCASAVVLDRRLGDVVLELGVSGLLLEGNALLFDRASESLWRQLTGEAVVGEHAGARLALLPSFVISFGELERSHPEAELMQAPQEEEEREHDLEILQSWHVEKGLPPSWLRPEGSNPLEMVLAVAGAGPLIRSFDAEVRNVDVDGLALVTLPDPATAAAYRAQDGGTGPALGSQAAFRREVRGRALTFEKHPRGARDRETGTIWNCLGEAIEGALIGERLEPAPHVQAFRFATTALRP